jgi:glycosyltransferase involved in cell wall biosynthesis
MLHWSKGIFVDSLVGKRHVIDSYGLAPGRICVLPYVAPEYIRAKKCPDGFNKRYSLPKKYIYYPAQFWKHKNHKGLIRAVALLKDKIPDLNLVLSGSSKNGYQAARKTVRECKLTARIHFLGYVPEADMSELYRRARALIMPTFFGPTNIPPLEAAATGCPMAISGVYGMRKQMEDAALYFNPSSIHEIASCIERLWGDDALCKELAHRGKARSMQWTQSHLNHSFSNIIESILPERPTPFQKGLAD